MFFSRIFLYADSTPFRKRTSRSARYGRIFASVSHGGAPKDSRSSSVRMAVRRPPAAFLAPASGPRMVSARTSLALILRTSLDGDRLSAFPSPPPPPPPPPLSCAPLSRASLPRSSAASASVAAPSPPCSLTVTSSLMLMSGTSLATIAGMASPMRLSRKDSRYVSRPLSCSDTLVSSCVRLVPVESTNMPIRRMSASVVVDCTRSVSTAMPPT